MIIISRQDFTDDITVSLRALNGKAYTFKVDRGIYLFI